MKDKIEEFRTRFEEYESLEKEVEDAIHSFDGWRPESGSELDLFGGEMAELYRGSPPLEEDIRWLELAMEEIDEANVC